MEEQQQEPRRQHGARVAQGHPPRLGLVAGDLLEGHGATRAGSQLVHGPFTCPHRSQAPLRYLPRNRLLAYLPINPNKVINLKSIQASWRDAAPDELLWGTEGSVTARKTPQERALSFNCLQSAFR